MAKGIIAGFLGGGANAMADVGKMLLSNQLIKERDEANFLRDSELRKTLAEEDRDFRATEAEKGRTAADTRAGEERKSREKIAADRIKSAESEGEKDRASRERIAAMKPGKNPQLIKYTDNKGYEQEGVLKDNGDGTYTIVKPDTGQVMETELTSAELKDMAAQMNVDEGKSDDWIPWNEYSPKDPEVRAAARAKKDKAQSQGIVGEVMQGETASSEGEGGRKIIGGRQMSQQEFIEAMVARYGESAMDDIMQTWNSIP